MTAQALGLNTLEEPAASSWRKARGLVRGLLLVVGLVISGGSWAWGAAGHRLIAEYADARMSPNARMQVGRLLALEPGATLASVSTWADEVRSPTTAAWHYLNFPRDAGCRYDAARMCIRGNCVVGAIERQLTVLASDAPVARKLLALKYVVHFVGDVHQPMHAGFADDRGGNSHQLQANRRGTNLHALWDVALLQHWPGGIGALRQAMESLPVTPGESDPRAWAEESCRLVAAPGFYPERRKLDENYPARWSAQLAQQLAAAGQRLAQVLNTALAGR